MPTLPSFDVPDADVAVIALKDGRVGSLLSCLGEFRLESVLPEVGVTHEELLPHILIHGVLYIEHRTTLHDTGCRCTRNVVTEIHLRWSKRGLVAACLPLATETSPLLGLHPVRFAE